MASAVYLVELVATVTGALVVGAVAMLVAIVLLAGPAGAATVDTLANVNCAPCVHRGEMLLALILAAAAGGLIGIVAGALWSLQR